MKIATVGGISPFAIRLSNTVGTRQSPFTFWYPPPSWKTITAAEPSGLNCAGTYTHQSRTVPSKIFDSHGGICVTVPCGTFACSTASACKTKSSAAKINEADVKETSATVAERRRRIRKPSQRPAPRGERNAGSGTV